MGRVQGMEVKEVSECMHSQDHDPVPHYIYDRCFLTGGHMMQCDWGSQM